MSVISKKSGVFFLLSMLAATAPVSVSAQELPAYEDKVQTTVYAQPPVDLTGMTEGPEVKGIISSRRGNKIKVRNFAGTATAVFISDGTEVKAKKGLFGGKNNEIGSESLITGLPVTIETVVWGDGLVASKVKFRVKDFKTAAMIHNGTSQRFGEQDAAIDSNAVGIDENAALARALRGRMGDIDKYNIKGTTNVYFDTGKWKLTPRGRDELCSAAGQANAMDNALLLVVGYTDSVGNQDYNQILSEKRAGRVVNYLQQACGWKPWRMLTPTGMAESDPLASNDTAEGKAQNRRVSVNILVSKGLDGL